MRYVVKVLVLPRSWWIKLPVHTCNSLLWSFSDWGAMLQMVSGDLHACLGVWEHRTRLKIRENRISLFLSSQTVRIIVKIGIHYGFLKEQLPKCLPSLADVFPQGRLGSWGMQGTLYSALLYRQIVVSCSVGKGRNPQRKIGKPRHKWVVF